MAKNKEVATTLIIGGVYSHDIRINIKITEFYFISTQNTILLQPDYLKMNFI